MMGRVRDSERLRAEGFGTSVEVRCAGIYALLEKGKLVYVKRSPNVWTALARIFATKRRRKGLGDTRLGSHWVDAKQFEFDELLIKYCYLSELESIELDLIERYQPEFNVRIRPVLHGGLKIEYSELMAMLGEKGRPFERRI
jgi:hypothetical protein